MVLGGHQDPTGRQIADRVVATVVAERQLDGASTEGQAEQLTAHANSENGDFPDQSGDEIGGTSNGCRIPGSVRQQHAGVAAPTQFINRDPGWDDPHREAFTDEATEDRALDAEIDHRHRWTIGIRASFKGM